MNETRTHVIVRHVRAMLHQTNVSLPSYSVAVVQIYHERTAPELRTVLFHTGGDAYRCMRSNAQIIRRYLDAEQRLPCELEESLVLALPISWRNNCLGELAARYGLLAARMPMPGNPAADIATLFREAGEAGAAIAQWLDDTAEIGPRERQMATHAEKELHDVIAAATGLLARIHMAQRTKDKTCPPAH